MSCDSSHLEFLIEIFFNFSYVNEQVCKVFRNSSFKMLEDLHTQTFVTDRRAEQEQYVSPWTGMGGDIINK